MQFAIQELWEVGLIQAIYWPSSPLFFIFWCLFALGVLIQWLLLKKAKRLWVRCSFAALLLIGLVAGEIGVQMITGFERLAPVFLYWFCLALLLGAALSWLLHRLFQGREK